MENYLYLAKSVQAYIKPNKYQQQLTVISQTKYKNMALSLLTVSPSVLSHCISATVTVSIHLTIVEQTVSEQ